MITFDVPSLTVSETIGGSETHRQTMLALYADIFPGYAYYLPYMDYKMRQRIDHDPAFLERWWLVEIEGDPAALAYFKYSPRYDLSFNLSVGVHPRYRRFSVAGHDRLFAFIQQAMEEQTYADAAAFNRPLPDGMVAENQKPEPGMTVDEQQWHLHVIERFHEMGYLEMPVIYQEPPYIIGTESFFNDIDLAGVGFHDMMLTIKPTKSLSPNDPDLMRRSALMILVDHYKLPLDHWAVQAALQSIEAQSRTV